MNNKIIFFGADGGCLDSYYLCNEVHKVSKSVILNDKKIKLPSNTIYGGGFSKIKTRKFAKYSFVYQCGNSKNHIKRHLWYNLAKENLLRPLTCIAKDTYIHPKAKIGKGSIIYHGVKIMRNVKIGENVIILPNCVINHDSKIGDFTIINSACVINGNVRIGNNVYLGSSSMIKENVNIKKETTIGMATAVVKTINKSGVYVGVPARKL